MARAINKLATRRVQTVVEPGRHSDGGGLYLIVDQNAAEAAMWRHGAGFLVLLPRLMAQVPGAFEEIPQNGHA